MRHLVSRSLILACLVLGLAACGSTAPGVTTPGVTPATVTFGTEQPLTGPAAPGVTDVGAASQEYFNYVNAHGGVFGRSIHLITVNDAGSPTQAVAAVNRLVYLDGVFGMFEGAGTAPQARVLPFLRAHRIPDVFMGSGCPCFQNGRADPYGFSWQPSATVEGKILGSYIRRHFPGQRVGVLYQADAAGRAGLVGVGQEVRHVVAEQSYALGMTTLAPQLRALQRARATVLVDFTLPAYTVLEQLTASKLGYAPQLLVSSGGVDPSVMNHLAATFSGGTVTGEQLLDGAITDTYLPPVTDTSNQWVRLFRRIHARYAPGTPFDAGAEYGMATAYTLVQALDVAGPRLSRRGLIQAIIDRGRFWRGPGLLPFRYSERDHGGFAGAQLARMEGGQLVLMGRPLVTTSRPGSPVRPWRGHQVGPPRGGIP